MKEKTFEYITNCIYTDGEDIQKMDDNSIEITYRTMAKYCNLKEWNRHFLLPLYKDWGVSFYRSKYKGKRCYYFCHSCIEYIFIKKGE